MSVLSPRLRRGFRLLAFPGLLVQLLAYLGEWLGLRGVLTLLVLAGGVIALVRYGPQAPELSPVQRHIAEALVDDIAAKLPSGPELGTVLLPPVENDWGSALEDLLRARITEQGIFRLAPAGSWQQMRKDLRLYPREHYDEARVAGLAKAMKEDHLMIARLKTYREDRHRAFGELTVSWTDKAPGEVRRLSASRELVKRAWSPDYLFLSARVGPLGQRLFYWFLAVIFFPVLAYPVTRAVTRRQSALANLVLTACYSLLLIAVTVFMLGPVARWWQGALFILASVFVIFYVLVTSNFVARVAGRAD